MSALVIARPVSHWPPHSVFTQKEGRAAQLCERLGAEQLRRTPQRARERLPQLPFHQRGATLRSERLDQRQMVRAMRDFAEPQTLRQRERRHLPTLINHGRVAQRFMEDRQIRLRWTPSQLSEPPPRPTPPSPDRRLRQALLRIAPQRRRPLWPAHQVCTTVVMAAHSVKLDPANAAYLTISQAPAWAALRVLRDVDPQRAAATALEAAGLPSDAAA